MKGISEFTVDQVKNWNNDTDGARGYKPARPIGMGGVKRRISKAWKVFTGKADLLVWPYKQ